MKSIWMVLTLTALCGPVVAATSQEDRMKSCNAQAGQKDLTGEERNQFISQCLSVAAPAAVAPAAAAPAAERATAKSAEKKLTAQQKKMKSCNADAKTKNLKGEPRKKFMSQCLKA